MNTTDQTPVVAIDIQHHAALIVVEHKAFEDASRKALQHARLAGAMLAEVKAALPHGSWGGWLDNNFPASRRTAQRFMQIAENWSAIESKAPRVADLSLREAERMLADSRLCEELARLEQVIEAGLQNLQQAGLSIDDLIVQVGGGK